MTDFNDDPAVGKPLTAVTAHLQQTRETLQTICQSLGLEAVAGIGVLKFAGEVNGRLITLTAAPRTRTRYLTPDIRRRHYHGFVVDVSAATTAKTRLLLMPPSAQWLHHLIQPRYGNQQLTNLPPRYDQLTVWAHDPDWATGFLGKTAVNHLLTILLDDNGKPNGNVLYLSPDTCRLTVAAPPANPTEATVHQWVEAVSQLTTLAEQNPPHKQASLTWLERQPANTRLFITAGGLLFGIPLLFFICCLLPILAALLLTAN